MKKLFFVLISGISLFLFMGINANASSIQLPAGTVEYSSLETVPNAANYKFGNFRLVQDYKLYEETDSTDFYLRVYEAEKPASLPVQILSEIYQMTNNGNIKYEHIIEKTETIFYEESLNLSINTEYGATVKSTCGVPLNNITTTISSSMSTSLTSEVKKKTELTLKQGTKVEINLNVGPGLYVVQRRAIYKYFIIQKVGVVYNLIKKGNRYIRGSEKRYALFETIGQFVCQDSVTGVVGIYEYERMSNGIDLQIVTSNFTDKDYIVYF